MPAPTNQRPPQWGEPGYQGPPRRKLTTRAKIIIALAIIGAALAVTAMVTDSNSSAGSSAAGDVDKVRLSTTADAIGIKQGFVQLTNHSQRIADYTIELRIMGATGVNLGTVNATADNVEPGQTARASFMVTDDSADHVEVVQIRRTAA